MHAREAYLGLDSSSAPLTTTLYYDPIIDVHHRLPVSAALTTAFYAAPQVPDDARRLFEAACISLGLDRSPDLPLRPNRAYGAALVLAREWELSDLEDRLVSAIEMSYVPTWSLDTGEFTWGLGLDEEHPRGQYNAFLAASEASGPGMWAKLSTEPVEPCPQIVDVDFPTLALSRAEWVNGALHVGLAPLRDDPTRRTTFRIVGAEPRQWDFNGLDGASIDVTAGAVIVSVPLVTAEIEFTPGSY